MSPLCLNVIMHLLVGCVIGLSQLPTAYAETSPFQDMSKFLESPVPEPTEIFIFQPRFGNYENFIIRPAFYVLRFGLR